MDILIRTLNGEDVSQVVKIQKQSPSAAQWNKMDYDRLIGQAGNLTLVASDSSKPGIVLGFVVFRQVEDEAELLNLAVAPSSRRGGIGWALMKEGIQQLMQSRARNIFLEVRASNQPAISFYAAMGFEPHSIRNGYYQNPDEDGYILKLELPGS